MNGLDLFSGYGGLTLGLSEWVRPVAYCEIDPYAQGILVSRMQDGHLPAAPVWDDIRTLEGRQFHGAVDIIYGGFPCQDISIAGYGKGLGGERSGLFYELLRLVEEIQPSFVFLENVTAIRTRGLCEVIISLANLGYDCRWACVAASDVGAPHERKRWFLLAYADRHRRRANAGAERTAKNECQELQQENRFALPNDSAEVCGTLANPTGEGLQRQLHKQGEVGEHPLEKGFTKPCTCCGFWEVEPDVGRVADGIAHRVDRIKALGNGVVPQQAKKAFEKLIGLSEG